MLEYTTWSSVYLRNSLNLFESVTDNITRSKLIKGMYALRGIVSMHAHNKLFCLLCSYVFTCVYAEPECTPMKHVKYVGKTCVLA